MGKKFTCSAGDTGDAWSILGMGRSPGSGNGNPLQYSCLKNPMDGGAWRATVQGVPKESDTTEQLRVHACMCHLQSSLYDSIHLHYYHHHNLHNNCLLLLLLLQLLHILMSSCLCAYLCLILYDPLDPNPPGSPVLGISQAGILEWVAISSSRGSSQPMDQTHVS